MGEREVCMTGGSPWGLTLSGGKDFGSPLKVSKVTAGGKAAQAGVKNGDYIIAINGEKTIDLLHCDAQQKIKFSVQTLRLTLSSEAPMRVSATRPKPQPEVTPAGRPRPPHCPVPVTTTSIKSHPPSQRGQPSLPTGHTHRPHQNVTSVANTPSSRQQPVVKSSVEAEQPVPSSLAPDAGLESGVSSHYQSPSFKKISVGATPTGSALRDHGPPTEAMKNVSVSSPNNAVKTAPKTAPRPQAPSNHPTKFTTQSIKVSSSTPSKQPPKPTPVATGNPPQPGEKVYSHQGVCSACHQPIRGPFASAMGHVYHPEHFVCTGCQLQLQNTTFVFEQGSVYCEKCYEEHFAQTCYSCQRPIVGGCISAVNLYWHPEHFKCSHCHTDLSQGAGFNFDDGQLFCQDCYTELHGTTCCACGNKIGGNDLWVEALDQTWHSYCFTCDACHRQLEGARFFAKAGRPFCASCA